MTMLGAFNAIPKCLADPLFRAWLAARSWNKKAGTGVEDVVVRLAITPEELEAAGRLLHDAYHQRGIIARNPSGLRLTVHTLLPSTYTFVAVEGGEVVGTLALIPDSPAGLPIEKLHRPEIASLRKQGRRLAEVGAYSIGVKKRHSGVGGLLHKLMWRVAREVLAVDDLVISIHPRAAIFYRAVLAFQPISKRIASYPGMTKQALEVAFRLDLRRSLARWYRQWRSLPASIGNTLHFFYAPSGLPPRLPDKRELEESRVAHLDFLDSILSRPEVAGSFGEGEQVTLRAVSSTGRRPQQETRVKAA